MPRPTNVPAGARTTPRIPADLRSSPKWSDRSRRATKAIGRAPPRRSTRQTMPCVWTRPDDRSTKSSRTCWSWCRLNSPPRRKRGKEFNEYSSCPPFLRGGELLGLPPVLVALGDLIAPFQLLVVRVLDPYGVADLVDVRLIGRGVIAARRFVAAEVRAFHIRVDVAGGNGRHFVMPALVL